MATRILGIDIGSIKICAAMAEMDDDEKVKIIAIASAESKGLKKGSITHIEYAAESIRKAVDDVKRVAGTGFDKVVVSISGKDVKNIDCKDIINIPDKEVNLKQIERAIKGAEFKVKVPSDYEIIHTLPYNFKIDSQDNIEDPLGMNGERLEVEAHMVAVQKSAITNLRKAVERAGLKADNVVLASYASAIATLNKDERDMGAILIDMGGATCDIAIHSGNSVRYTDFLAVGSWNITNDLSQQLHTPIADAEDVKIKFGTLRRQGSEVVTLPILGEESETCEKSMNLVIDIIYARVDETLRYLAKKLSESGYVDLAAAGVVLTGGMTKLDGIRDLAVAIFAQIGKNVRVAKPMELEGLVEAYKDQAYSCAIGLCLYGAGRFTPYEIDSERELRYKGEPVTVKTTSFVNADLSFTNQEEIKFENTEPKELIFNELDLKIEGSSNEPKQPKERKLNVSWLTKFWNWIKDLF